MISINAPKNYIQEVGITQRIGGFVKNYPGEILVISTPTAIESVQQSVISSLKFEDRDFQISIIGQYCTNESIAQNVQLGKVKAAEVVIGIGGGAVLDVAKAVADELKIPIITIPTVAATCAAWTALSVIYDETGTVIGARILNNSPELVLVDPEVLVKAPIRYIQSGIADTLVKWYEFEPHIQPDDYDPAFQISLHTAKLAIQVLNEYGLQAVQDNNLQQVTKAFIEVVDAIIALAGFVGSVKGGPFKAPIAHTIHNSLTTLSDVHHSLHGEKVIFGLIAQFVLENKKEQEIEDFIDYLKTYNLPVTLYELGIVENIADKVKQVARATNVDTNSMKNLTFDINELLVEAAIIKADLLGKKRLAVII